MAVCSVCGPRQFFPNSEHNFIPVILQAGKFFHCSFSFKSLQTGSICLRQCLAKEMKAREMTFNTTRNNSGTSESLVLSICHVLHYKHYIGDSRRSECNTAVEEPTVFRKRSSMERYFPRSHVCLFTVISSHIRTEYSLLLVPFL